MVRVRTSAVLTLSLLVAGSLGRLHAQEEEAAIPPEQGCSFRADPVEFLNTQRRLRDSVHRRVKEFADARFAAAQAEPQAAATRRNFIDDEIFGKLKQLNVPSAGMSSDEEFVRRVYLDIIGRIPTSQAVKEFVLSSASDKRDRLIDVLISAPEFNDKWAGWYEDLVGMLEHPSPGNRGPRIEGRNSGDRWIRPRMQNSRQMTEIVVSPLPGPGSNY